MALPPGGILTRAQVLGFRRVQDALDPSPQPLGRFRNSRPQRLEHLQNVVCGDLIDWLTPKEDGISREGHLPLLGVLSVAPAGLHRLDISFSEIPKIRNLLLE